MHSQTEMEPGTSTTNDGEHLLRQLVHAPLAALTEPAPATQHGVVIGEIVGLTNGGTTPLVIAPEQARSTALPARTVVDLHGSHIGRQVVLMFDHGDPARPIVMGLLRFDAEPALIENVGQVQVDADGERIVLSAKQQLVLRCGKASITLTRAGKVLVEGSYVLSRSTGVNRIKGGSVQLN